MIYKFALVDNPYHGDTYRDINDAHGTSVVLMGRFYETSPKEAREVIRMIFRTDGVRVDIYTRSPTWDNIVLGSFTSHWFKVMCGEITHKGKEQPLRESDLKILGDRFWNTMAYSQGAKDWRMESKTKAEEFWTWLLHRTRKLGIDNTILQRPALGPAGKLQHTVKESYYDKSHQKGDIRVVQFDEKKDEGHKNNLDSFIKRHDISKDEAKISESKANYLKLLGKNGESSLEKKRKESLTKAREEMRKAVKEAGAGDDCSDCLKKGDSILKKYGRERDLWLGDLLLSVPKDNLVKIVTPYLRPPKNQSQEDRANIKLKFDVARLMLLGEISFKTHGWRADAISKIWAAEPKLKDELVSQHKKLEDSFSSLQCGLSTCERYLPAK